MKILSGNHSTFLWVVVVFFCFLSDAESSTNSTKKHLKNGRGKSFLTAFFTKNNNNITYNNRSLCKWLKGVKHQNRLCLKKKGLAEILLETRKMAISSCTNNFQYEQWSCMRQRKFFKRIYRETAFLQSLSSSAFTHSIAKACAAGKLENCKCASHGKSDNPSAWQWGGCGDNSKFAKNFANKFFQLKKKGDIVRSILTYNSEIGIEVVMKNEEKVCKCHGLSGSCTYKTCFKRMRAFNEITKELKSLYHGAIQAQPDNSVFEIQKEKLDGHLVYLETSPNFCPLTVGRRCKDADNCATLCCGRTFSTSKEVVKETCNCRWRNESAYEIKCEVCERDEMVYLCQ